MKLTVIAIDVYVQNNHCYCDLNFPYTTLTTKKIIKFPYSTPTAKKIFKFPMQHIYREKDI